MTAPPAAATSVSIDKVHPCCTEEKLLCNTHHTFTMDTRPSQLLTPRHRYISHVPPSRVSAGPQ